MAKEAESDLRITDEFDIEVFWAHHGKKVIVGIAAVLAIGGFVWFRQNQATQRLEQAMASLTAARDPAALEQVAHEFAGTYAALEALSRLADEQFRAAKYADASATFERILKEFPANPLAESARLGLAAVQEAQGNLEAAKGSYSAIVESAPNGFTTLAARVGVARCSEALGQLKEARQLYEEIMVGAQRSPWSKEAYLRWTTLGREMPAAPQAASEVAPAVPPSSPSLGTQPAKNVQQ